MKNKLHHQPCGLWLHRRRHHQQPSPSSTSSLSQIVIIIVIIIIILIIIVTIIVTIIRRCCHHRHHVIIMISSKCNVFLLLCRITVWRRLCYSHHQYCLMSYAIPNFRVTKSKFRCTDVWLRRKRPMRCALEILSSPPPPPLPPPPPPPNFPNKISPKIMLPVVPTWILTTQEQTTLFTNLLWYHIDIYRAALASWISTAVHRIIVLVFFVKHKFIKTHEKHY